MKKILVDAELSAPYLQEIKINPLPWSTRDSMVFRKHDV